MKSYTIRNAVVPVLSTVLLLAVGTGCANENARYIDSGGSQSVVTLNQIDIQDWNKAGTDMVQSLLGSGTLDTAPRIPAIMAISRITNKTSEVVDTDLLTKNIRIALLQSGKVRTSTTIGLGGASEDPLADDIKKQQRFENRSALDLPDFSLSGKILENTARAGSTKQVTYTFQLSLTDKSGNAVWEDQRQITKQGKRARVGF